MTFKSPTFWAVVPGLTLPSVRHRSRTISPSGTVPARGAVTRGRAVTHAPTVLAPGARQAVCGAGAQGGGVVGARGAGVLGVVGRAVLAVVTWGWGRNLNFLNVKFERKFF